MEPWEKLHDDGCEALVAAITKQAMQDYIAELKHLKRNRGNMAARANIKRLREFFRGSYFSTLSGLDGQYLIERMEREFAENKGKSLKLRSSVRINRPPAKRVRGTHSVTGAVVEYDSCDEAGRVMGVCGASIRNGVKGHKPTVCGYYWEYIPD